MNFTGTGTAVPALPLLYLPFRASVSSSAPDGRCPGWLPAYGRQPRMPDPVPVSQTPGLLWMPRDNKVLIWVGEKRGPASFIPCSWAGVCYLFKVRLPPPHPQSPKGTSDVFPTWIWARKGPDLRTTWKLPPLPGSKLIILGGSFPGGGHGNPLHYSCLENSMDGGAWWATDHGFAKSRTRLSDFTFTFVIKWNTIIIFLNTEN